jgi:hypothetical protein
MNNMDEDIYVKREKNITVEGSKVSPQMAQVSPLHSLNYKERLCWRKFGRPPSSGKIKSQSLIERII